MTSGHTFFLEDGIEQDNVIEGNLGVLTRPSQVLSRGCRPGVAALGFSTSAAMPLTLPLHSPGSYPLQAASFAGSQHLQLAQPPPPT